MKGSRLPPLKDALVLALLGAVGVGIRSLVVGVASSSSLMCFRLPPFASEDESMSGRSSSLTSLSSSSLADRGLYLC